MCSGLMVFFESFSQISFASDETVKRNSVNVARAQGVSQCEGLSEGEGLRCGGPLQQSTMRSLTSFVAVNPAGRNSVCVWGGGGSECLASKVRRQYTGEVADLGRVCGRWLSGGRPRRRRPSFWEIRRPT